MTLAKLSAYLEQFLLVRRTMAEADPHFGACLRRLLRYKEKLLRNFRAFWKQQGCPWPIRSQTVLDWITASSHPEHPYRDQHYFYALRAFLRQLRTFEPETEVPESPFRFRHPRRRPYIFSEGELVRLMRATKRLRLFDSFRVATIRTLIGLLASAGLRIGEALRLKLEDVKLAANPPYLVICDTKFGKSRNVVLHLTTRNCLQKYLCERAKVLGGKRVACCGVREFVPHRGNEDPPFIPSGTLLRYVGSRSGIATGKMSRNSCRICRCTSAISALQAPIGI